MGKYVLAYRGGSMPETEEESARVMAAWDGWYGVLGESIVDGGNPFGQTRVISATGEVTMAEVPLSGYTIISAADLDGAVSAAKGCPIFEAGGTVEVAEAIDM